MSLAKLSTNNEWLVWARKTACYDKETIAKKLNISIETIKQWEETGEIEYKNLLKLAKEYKRPTMMFFSRSKPKYEKETTFFRTINNINKPITPKIAFEIRHAKFRRENLLRIEKEVIDYEIPKFTLKNLRNEDFKKIPITLNDKLEMNNIHIKKEKIGHWIKKIESLGILVFEFYNINIDEMRGYALYDDKLPIIGINHRESENSKKFTLFHELAHLLIKKESISTANSYFFIDKDEQVSNEIAAETIVPTYIFENEIKSYKIDEFSPQNIQKLAKYFKVSSDVIVRRALTLKFIDKQTYENRVEEFNGYFKSKKHIHNKKSKNKNVVKEKEDKERKINAEKQDKRDATLAIRKNGTYYTETLIDAYENNTISDLDLSTNLGVSLEVVQKIINWRHNI
jgi:Zn-dependent peptidase ImmA (M78 family)